MTSKSLKYSFYFYQKLRNHFIDSEQHTHEPYAELADAYIGDISPVVV